MAVFNPIRISITPLRRVPFLFEPVVNMINGSSLHFLHNRNGRSPFSSLGVSSHVSRHSFDMKDFKRILHRISPVNYSTSLSNTCTSCIHEYSLSRGQDGSTSGPHQVIFANLVSCPKCNALQSIPEKMLPNYFEMFGQNVQFRIDPVKISFHAKRLQKIFHPDLYTGQNEEQKELSQKYSSLINEAVAILMNPLSRGRYIMSLSGMKSTSDSETNMTKDPEFLETVMELNEQLETIKTAQSWKEFENQNRVTLADIDGELERALDKHDFQKAELLLQRMKYYTTLQEKVKELQSRIGIIQ